MVYWFSPKKSTSSRRKGYDKDYQTISGATRSKTPEQQNQLPTVNSLLSTVHRLLIHSHYPPSPDSLALPTVHRQPSVKIFSRRSRRAYSIDMAFERSKILPGLIYVPQKKKGCMQKHHCPDCFSCQMCGDERCKVCQGGRKKPGRKPVCPEGDDQ
jgi:hypothetical protein